MTLKFQLLLGLAGAIAIPAAVGGFSLISFIASLIKCSKQIKQDEAALNASQPQPVVDSPQSVLDEPG